MNSVLQALHTRLSLTRGRGDRGFTLIELIVVIIIIGILAAIAIPVFLGQQQQARDSSAKSAITNAKTEIVAAIVETGTFPADADAIADAAAGDPDITIDVTGDATGFCIEAEHVDGTGYFHATDTGGVEPDGCP